MFLETPRPTDNLSLKIAKILIGLLGLSSIIALPLLRIINSGIIDPTDFVSLPHLVRAILLTALGLIPEMFSHPLIWLFLPVIIMTMYLLIGRRVRKVIDWLAIILTALLSIVSVVAYMHYHPNLDESSLFNGNLIIDVRNESGEVVQGVQVCAMRYAFRSDHLWNCRTSDEQGRIYFSAKPGIYDLSLANDSLVKYPSTQTQRLTVSDDPVERTVTVK